MHEFLIFRQLQSKVISLAMFGSIMAFGLETGQLVIYVCKDIEKEISELHKRKPDFSRHMFPDRLNEAIISIDIDDYGKGPIVVATTSNAISILKWNPK